MKERIITIEINGKKIRVGRIRGDTPAEACFSYDSEYLGETRVRPVSISLPLQEEPFSPAQTKNFFEGLLPEGFTRRSVAQWMHVDEGDYLSILSGLGRECLGALQVFEEGQEREKPSYKKLSPQRVLALAREGTTVSADLVIKAHLSLTGASGKVGLYYDADNGDWYLPGGDAPSTHILKQSHVRLLDIVANEQLCMLTARHLGMEVPDSFVVNPGDPSREEVLFATRRFDRYFAENAGIIDGHKVPCRLHQEDFAQALGIPAAEKYENQKRGYLARMFELLRSWSSDPVADQLRLWDILVFDCLIGNTDNHLKNLSLLYSADMRSIRLAPAYDIVSTSVYEGATREMSYYIGNENNLDRLTETDFREAAKEAGMSVNMCLARYKAMKERFPDALESAFAEMSSIGIPSLPELKNKILHQWKTAEVPAH